MHCTRCHYSLNNFIPQAFFIYAAAFYCNMGNYKSFGDTKFVPNVDAVSFDNKHNTKRVKKNYNKPALHSI